MSNLTPFCPRCGGKMYHVRDLYGEYNSCINCGHHSDVLTGPPIELKTPWKVKRGRGPSRGGQKL